MALLARKSRENRAALAAVIINRAAQQWAPSQRDFLLTQTRRRRRCIFKRLFGVEGIKTANENTPFTVPASNECQLTAAARLQVHAAPRWQKLWRDTAITHGALHTSLATEYPWATHGRASAPEWPNKIAFKSSARCFPDERSSAGRHYFQADSVRDVEDPRPLRRARETKRWVGRRTAQTSRKRTVRVV